MAGRFQSAPLNRNRRFKFLNGFTLEKFKQFVERVFFIIYNIINGMRDRHFNVISLRKDFQRFRRCHAFGKFCERFFEIQILAVTPVVGIFGKQRRFIITEMAKPVSRKFVAAHRFYQPRHLSRSASHKRTFERAKTSAVQNPGGNVWLRGITSTDNSFSAVRIIVILSLVLFPVLVLLTAVLLGMFLRTRLGLAIRATGDNPDMVRSSSINPAVTTIVGLCLSNALTALSGCLLAQSQKSVNIDIGTGMVTVALASLLIGGVFLGRKKLPLRIFGMVLGAFVFRLVYTVALRFDMPAFMLKLVSAVVVVAAISIPYLKEQYPLFRRRIEHRMGRRRTGC